MTFCAGSGSEFRLRTAWLVALFTTFTNIAANAVDIDTYREVLKAGDDVALARLLARDDGKPPLASGGETVLHLATSHNHADNRPRLIEVLLAAGVPVDARDGSGNTPLHWAAGFGCVPCVPVLLSGGADPDARRFDGGTPLHRAAPETAPLLLAAGADPLARDGDGRVPLHTAYRGVDGLLVAGVDARDNYGLTPLHHAALSGNLDQVDWLLANGANPALESTAVYAYSEDAPGDAWHSTHDFDVGMRAYDIARWQHRRTRFNTSRYTAVLERLDRVTPRRGWFSR
ncbi:MAG: ankyrin repeat domain-containing protein [Pseudomonadales bacterium]|nr:ankyrin repeat domain-containing protein [Pseudomonadales bacterium]MCP5184176.1 ankyrin repeat domain-containing protein [Pseudomonadales bacterium]